MSWRRASERLRVARRVAVSSSVVSSGSSMIWSVESGSVGCVVPFVPFVDVDLSSGFDVDLDLDLGFAVGSSLSKQSSPFSALSIASFHSFNPMWQALMLLCSTASS